MPLICSYKNCYHVRNGVATVTCFSLPTDHRRAVWIKHTGCESKTYGRFCEQHFYKNDMRSLSCRKALRKTAYPKPYSTSVCSCTETVMDDRCKALEMKPAQTPTKVWPRKQALMLPKDTLVSPATVKNLDFDTIAIDQNFSFNNQSDWNGSCNASSSSSSIAAIIKREHEGMFGLHGCLPICSA